MENKLNVLLLLKRIMPATPTHKKTDDLSPKEGICQSIYNRTASQKYIYI